MRGRGKMERVKVSIRIRPFSDSEKLKDPSSPICNIDTKNNSLEIKRDYDKKNFSYDHVFPMDSKQEDIFDNTSKEVINSVLKGYNGTIFAYGQTGSGKTFTMLGDSTDIGKKGIIPRTFDYIFDEIKKDKENKYNIIVGYIQIYLESIQDLIEPSNNTIRIREDPQQGVYLEGIQWLKVENTTQCEQIIQIGNKNRVTAGHLMSINSSRSHAIFITRIEKSILLSKEKIKELSNESQEKIKSERVMTNSFLYLVDLAGSERIAKAGVSGMRLEEAKKINYSLLILGNCIQALAENKIKYIPYRDSKLTRLLQESLGGNAKTSLIVTLSPSGYNTDETLSSLNFALRAMKVQNKPIINQSVDYQALCIKLQEDLDKLRDEHAELQMSYDKLVEENEKLKNGETLLELQKNKIKESVMNLEPGPELGKGNNTNISFSNKNGNNKLAIEKEKFEAEIKKLESFYQGVIKNKTEEYEKILKDIDKIFEEKEKSMNKISQENKTLNNQIKNYEETINDYKKEKDDLMNSITDLTNKLNFEREAKENKSVEVHKKEIEKLNNHIEMLEKKIIPLENLNNLNNGSILAIQNKIEEKIKEIKEEKASLQKEKSDNVIKISQNDIKIKLDQEEIGKIHKKMTTISDEMKIILSNRENEINSDIEIRQLNSNKISELQDDLLNRITNIDEEIKKYKQLKDNIGLIGNDEISLIDKTEIIGLNKINETNSLLMTKRYEDNINRLKKYLDNINQMNKNINQLNGIIKNLKKENNELTSKLAVNSKKNEKDEETNNKKIRQYELKINNLQNELNNLKKNLSEEKKINNDRNSKIIEGNNKSSEEYKKKIEKLMKENIDLKKNLAIMKQNNSKLSNELQENSNQVAKLKSKNEKDINEKILSYETQINLLNKELESKEKIINDSISINENMNKSKQDKENELKKLKSEKNLLNDKINNYELKIIQLNNEINNKQKIINESITENENMQIKINENDELIKKLNNNNKIQLNNINKLNNEIKELKLKLNLSETSLNNINNDNKKLMSELNNKSNNIKNSETELNILNNKLLEFNKTNEQLITNYDDLSEKYKKQEEKNTILNSSLDKVTKEMNYYKEVTDKLNSKISTINNELKIVNKKNESLTKELNEKEQLISENLGKTEIDNKVLEEYKQKLANLKKENLELNKNNMIINENNDKLNTKIKFNEDEIEQLKNQIDKELLPKINNYETHINILKKEIKTKEKIINENSANNEKESLNMNMKNNEIKKLKSECEQSNKEIEILNKEINTLKLKLFDKEKEVSKLNEEIKSMGEDNSTQKDDLNNEIVVLKNKITSEHNSNEELLKKIDLSNKKIQSLQENIIKLTQKNTELLKELLGCKEKIEILNADNQKLKIENTSHQQALLKLTSLSKNDTEAKQNALVTVKDLNKKITEYLVILNNKENEIRALKDENFKLKNDINDLNSQLKNKNNIEAQINELKLQQNRAMSNNSELNDKLNMLSSNCDDAHEFFVKFQSEIESIQKSLNSHKNINTNINLENLNKLIDEENEYSIDELNQSIQSTMSAKKNKNYERKINLINNKKEINNKPVELCILNINDKLLEGKSKFLSLTNSYYNCLTHVNKKINEIGKIHKILNDLTTNLMKNIIPNLENFNEILNHYEKKIYKSQSDDETIFYLNKLINETIMKLKDSNINQKKEIDKLHDRVEFFINECAIMKKCGETLAKEQDNINKQQKEKYEKQIKNQNEEMNQLKTKMSEQLKDNNENIKKNNYLVDELLEMKEKYNIQTKDIENIDKIAKEQNKKIGIKDLNTGKYIIKDFLGKIREFSGVLYSYTDIK